VTVRPIPPVPQALAMPEADTASPAEAGQPQTFADALGEALRSASSALRGAESAEAAFIRGRGGLQEMVVERAQADIMLAIASATAQRTAQSLTTLLNMQV
jgi:flagellar hook-basal body complex protein FliE